MKFELEEENFVCATFDQVADDQFFICEVGCFCQRVNDEIYNVIADSKGVPAAIPGLRYRGQRNIKKILPKVTKITWE